MTKPRTYNGKIVIWESKSKQIIASCICLSFAVIALTLKEQYSTWMFWFTFLFFGLGGIFLLVRILNPKNLFVTLGSSLGKEIGDAWFLEDQLDLGFFSYSQTGFTYDIENISFEWSEIECVFAFKEDLLTTDNVCLELFAENQNFKLDEATFGWFQFVERLEKALSIKRDWMKDVVHPAFETNLTLVFEKNNLNEAEAISKYYR